MINRAINFVVCRRIVWFLTLIFVLPLAAAADASEFSPSKTKARTSERKQISVWRQISENDLARRGRRRITPEKRLVYGVRRNALTALLAAAPTEFSEAARLTEIVLELPTPDGRRERFRVEESPLLSPEIAAEFPDWKTYQGYGIDDPTATARFDVTMGAFHGYVLSSRGTYAIDPFQENDPDHYIVYAKEDLHKDSAMRCNVGETENRFAAEDSGAEAPQFTNGTQIRTYRLAVAATAEYTAFFRQTGDTDAQAQSRALAAIVVSINRNRGLYRRDLAVDFTLVSGTNVIFTDAATDGYTNDDGEAMLSENQTKLDAVIGSANYDIGHVFSTRGGGIAYLRSVCNTSIKAGGVTGQSAPVGDPFDIDYVAHEMGHQFGQNHTFNAPADCGLSPLAARVEPGSGVTIMGYAGICGSTSNLARNSIDVFHVYNIAETVGFITNPGTGGSCGTLSGSNAVPVIAALSNYSIPRNTPFALTASATDANGNSLTYNWEQNNAGANASDYPGTTDDDDANTGIRPLFRSYVPSASGTRVFPSLTYILNNANEAPVTYTGTSATGAVCAETCITGEDLPSNDRTMTFRVTVRDGQGGNADATISVTAVTAGATPFQITTQNSAVSYIGGNAQTVTWNVGGTTAAPINAANVRISLSTDGGQTFPNVLAASTVNDGSETVTIPNLPTTQARLKIEAVGNIFFDINNVNFTITANPTAAAVAVGGRVTTAAGRGISRAVVTMTDAGGTARSVVTNQFGYYRLTDVSAGETYTFSVSAKGYIFSQAVRIRSVSADTEDINFTGESVNPPPNR